MSTGRRLYLHLGEKVTHSSHETWGEGVVVEEMTSSLPGGTCLVRVMFEDGRQRTFHNDLENELCCYFFGVRKVWTFDYGVGDSRRLARRRITSR